MAASICMRRWFSWPSRFALLLGIGALSVAGAEAAPSAQGEQPQSSADRSGELRVWSEEGRVYLKEAGAAARELRLGDTEEARRLKALLQRDGATGAGSGIRLDRMLLAGGGGCGFDWVPPQTVSAPNQTAAASRSPADGARPTKSTSAPATRQTAKTRHADKD